MLYLTWLMDAAANDIDEELEPPVPPGLQELSAPLTEFVRFFQLDPFLVQAADAISGSRPGARRTIKATIPGAPRCAARQGEDAACSTAILTMRGGNM